MTVSGRFGGCVASSQTTEKQGLILQSGMIEENQGLHGSIAAGEIESRAGWDLHLAVRVEVKSALNERAIGPAIIDSTKLKSAVEQRIHHIGHHTAARLVRWVIRDQARFALHHVAVGVGIGGSCAVTQSH